MASPAEGSDMLPAFLKINGELRRINNDQIAALASKTSPKQLWRGPFVQLGNSQVEASFADHRTYFYKGKEVDQQDHLGFDLAVTSRVPSSPPTKARCCTRAGLVSSETAWSSITVWGSSPCMATSRRLT